MERATILNDVQENAGTLNKELCGVLKTLKNIDRLTQEEYNNGDINKYKQARVFTLRDLIVKEVDNILLLK